MKAMIALDGNRYAGAIGNISEGGLYMLVAPTGAPVDFTPGTVVRIESESPSGIEFKLHYSVKWSYKNPPLDLTYSVGLTCPKSLYHI
jgi:hypothetical protein